jgi:hypothetical protein
MSIRGELAELKAKVETLTIALNTFKADHKESMATLTALLKTTISKNNQLEDAPISNGHRSNNTDTQPSTDLLDALAQNKDEGFTEYLTRWRQVYTQIQNRPKENELIPKFVASLEPTYHNIMKGDDYKTFKDLATFGARIEAAIKSGTLSKPVNPIPQESMPQNSIQVMKGEVLDVLSSPANNSPHPKKKVKREFTPLPMSYGEAFNKLRNSNRLQPLKPTIDPPVDERPVGWNPNAFCLYHRGNGHDTEHCFRLKHKIQDMIESGAIPDPSKL